MRPVRISKPKIQKLILFTEQDYKIIEEEYVKVAEQEYISFTKFVTERLLSTIK